MKGIVGQAAWASEEHGWANAAINSEMGLDTGHVLLERSLCFILYVSQALAGVLSGL